MLFDTLNGNFCFLSGDVGDWRLFLSSIVADIFGLRPSEGRAKLGFFLVGVTGGVLSLFSGGETVGFVFVELTVDFLPEVEALGWCLFA